MGPHALLAARAIDLLDRTRQAKGNILGRAEMGEKGIILKHHAHVATLGRHPYPLAGHAAIADENTTLLGALEPCHQAQQGCLAAS